MKPELSFVALFVVATAVALIARRLRLPYTVALVIAGLALGSAHIISPPHLTKDLLYAVFLPGLIFEAAFALEASKFWQNKLAIVSLALPGLLVAVGLTAVMLVPIVNGLHFVDGFTLGAGLIFSAVIAATDPIAVVGLFKSLGAPKRLAVLVEGESLLNDGTAVVVFTLITAAVERGSWSALHAAIDFARVVGMGVLVGLLVGYAVSWAIHAVDDAMIEITLTTIAAYGSFVLAEHFHFSGVIATVAAGMLCGNHAARTGMSAPTRVAVQTFWEYLAFALNSLVFLLIGFQVKVEAMVDAAKPIAVAWLVVTVGRAIVTHLVRLALSRTSERFSASWGNVLTWGGLRGGLSMVLVLGLSEQTPYRSLIINMTFGVVVLSILLQGLTMAPLLRRLGLVGKGHALLEHERLTAARVAIAAGLDELSRMVSSGALSPRVADEVRASSEQRRAEVEQALAELQHSSSEMLEEERRVAQRRVLLAEKAAILDAKQRGVLGPEAAEALLAQADERLVSLESPGGAH